MEGLRQSVDTAAITLIGGSVLYFINQVVSKLIIEPYLAYRTLLGDITYRLATNQAFIVSARYLDAPEKHADVSLEVRDLAARLRATAATCPCRWILRLFGLIPRRKVLAKSVGLLYGISARLLETEKKNDLIYTDYVQLTKLLQIELGQD